MGFAEEMLVSKPQKKESSGEFFCREFTRWKSLPRVSLRVRSSLRLSSKIQPCSMSHCTRTHQDETATPTTNRQLAPASSRSTPFLAFRREFPDSSPNCPSSAEL